MARLRLTNETPVMRYRPLKPPNPERAKALIALGFASALWGVFGIVLLLKVAT